MRTLVAALLAAAYVMAGLATLGEFPLVWDDEPWYAQSAWAFTEQGRFTLPMFADHAGFDQENLVYGWTYLALQALVIELAGLSPYSARLVSFISALVAITATYGIGRELWGPRAGALAALFTAIAPNFVLQSHDARPELMLVAFWTVAFYLTLLGQRRGSALLLFLAGLLAAVSADVHLNGLIIGPALFLVLLVRRASPRLIVTLLAGGLVGAAWFASVHLLRDPTIFREQIDTFGFGLPLFDVLTDPLEVVALEVARYVLVEPRLTLVLVVFALISALILLARHRDRALVALLTFGLSVFVFMMLFSGTKVVFYVVLLVPFGALLVARLLDVLPPRPAWVVGGVVALASFVGIFLTVASAVPNDYEGYVAKLREHVPPAAVIQGDPLIWYGFSDHEQIADPYFLFVGPYATEVERLGIEYIVGDGRYHLPACDDCLDVAPELRAFMAERTELVAEIRDPHYGDQPAPDGDGFITRIHRVTDG